MDQVIVHPITIEEMTRLAKIAGEIMKKWTQNFTVDVKGDTTPLTEADEEINIGTLDECLLLDPGIDFQGEEKSRRTDSKWKILLDPIDGTYPYTWYVGVYTFMMTLLYDGKPVRSVIYDPSTDRMYTAEKGKGAFLNGKRIHVSPIKPGDALQTIGVVEWKQSAVRMHLIADHLVNHQDCYVVDLASIGLMETLVANGSFQGTVFPQNKDYSSHDTAAGDLLVTEAGGMVTDLSGNPIDYNATAFNGHIMANCPETHAMLLRTVNQFGQNQHFLKRLWNLIRYS